MIDKSFVDTNVLIYAYNLDAGSKHTVAENILRELWLNANGAISTQVLQEFYVNVTKKIRKPLKPLEARVIISRYVVWHVEEITLESIISASELQERRQLSFWDSLIVVAASKSTAKILLSEDPNHGQIIEGVKVINPFQ